MSASKAARCGELHDGRRTNVGCGDEFCDLDEVYRCVDCGVYMHAHCMRRHFAMSSMDDLRPMVKYLRSSLNRNGLGDDGEQLPIMTPTASGGPA